MEIVYSNLDLILSAVVVIITAVILARRGQISLLRDLILSLVVSAEQNFGGGTGEIKKSEVTSKIYDMLPTISKLLISSSTISDLIEEAKLRMDSLSESNEAVDNFINKKYQLL